MDSRILWRAALVQLVAVAALSIVLGLALPHDFFVDWGWIAGVLAGLPSLVAVLIDLHWAGAILAVGLFALWCARLPRDDASRA